MFSPNISSLQLLERQIIDFYILPGGYRLLVYSYMINMLIPKQFYKCLWFKPTGLFWLIRSYYCCIHIVSVAESHVVDKLETQ